MPIEIIRATGAQPGDDFEVWLSTDAKGLPQLILSPYQPGCILCGASLKGKPHRTVGEKQVCMSCVAELNRSDTITPSKKENNNRVLPK